MKKYIIIILFFITLNGFSQEAVVIKNFEGEKYSETQWGPDNKHFAHYQFRYALLIPGMNSSEIENTLASGNFAAGYIYRYKIINLWDIGLEIGYENISVRIDENYHNLFDSINYDKMRIYQNCLNFSLFNRIILGGNTIRNLGWHIDVGGFYSYSFNKGLFKYSNNKNEEIKIRQKNPQYLNGDDYGLFLRVGKNNLAFYLRYSLSDLIIDMNENNYSKTPVSCGIQLNLYAK